MRQKNNFRILRKRFHLYRLFAVGFLIFSNVFVFPLSALAQAFSSASLSNAFKSYVAQPSSPPSVGGVPAGGVVMAKPEGVISSKTLSSGFKNYVNEAPTPVVPATQPETIIPPTKNSSESNSSSSPIYSQVSSSNIYNATLASALRDLLKTKEFSSQLRGPEGPRGAEGATGPAGTPTTNAMYFGQAAANPTPSAPPTIPQVFFPTGIIYPAPTQTNNFNGATFSGATNVSSNHLSTGTGTITELTVRETATIGSTLTVSGATTLSGTLNVTGATTIPNLTVTVGTADSMTIGGGYGATGVSISNTGNISANGALIVDGASTLTGALIIGSTAAIAGTTTIGGGYGSTGVTISDTGNISANGNLIVDGTLTFSGSSGGGITPTGQFVATHVPTLPHNYTSFPTGTSNAADSTVYINPASAGAGDMNLLSAAVGGAIKFQVDSEGDIFGNNLILTGTTSLASTNIGGSLIVQGNTTLGDAGSDTLTITGTAISIPNNANFDSNTLFIDSTNNKVGVGTATPVAIFDVSGNTGTSTTSSDIGSLGAGSTGAITVGSTTGFPSSGTIIIDGEALEYSATTATTITVSARGRLGTTAATHTNGTTVSFVEQLLSKGATTTPHLMVNSLGNVAIGTASSPLTGNNKLLAISSSSANGITISNTSQSASNTTFDITNEGSTLRLTPVNDAGVITANGLQIDRSGNVGVGTASPGTILDVNGVTTLRGNLLPNADNSYDVGASGTGFKTGYFSTSILSPTHDTATGVAMNIGTSTQTALTVGRAGANTTINGANTGAGLTIGPTAWTATPTISGLITATSGITSNGTMTVAAGFTQTGVNTFSTGTSAVSLNGDTTVASGKTFTVTSGTTSILGATSINTSGSNATNIGTGTNAGTITIGNASTGDLALNDANWSVTGAGAANFVSLTTTNAPTISAFTLGSVIFAGTGGLLSQDNASLFFDDTNNRLGIGTATPNEGKVHIVGGSMAADARVFYASGTLGTTPTASVSGAVFSITSSGSSSTFNRTGLESTLAAGYTGDASAIGLLAQSLAASSGVASPLAWASAGTIAVKGRASATGAGNRFGGLFTGDSGTTNNVGVIGYGWAEASMTGAAYGVIGIGDSEAGGADTAYGGYFKLNTNEAITSGAALVADNGTQALDIFQARDNGTAVVTIGNGGFMGVGATPGSTYKLDVSGTTRLTGGAGTADGQAALVVTDATNATFRLSFDNASNIQFSGNEGQHNLLFGGKSGDATAFTPRFTINNVTGNSYFNSGNVGIGTTAPVAALNIPSDKMVLLGHTTALNSDATAQMGPTPPLLIVGNDATSYPMGFLGNGTQAGGSAIIVQRTHSTGTDANTIVASGDRVFDINAYGADGASFQPLAKIAMAVDGTPGSGDMPGRITFSTSADGAATFSERMRIDNAGNVGIGTTAPIYTLDVSKSVAGDWAGRIYNSSATGYGAIIRGGATNGTTSALIVQDQAGGTLMEVKGNGVTTINGTTASTASTNGTLVISGGVGIATATTTASTMGLNVAHSGAISGTGYAGYFSKTGASTTNVGLYATATGGLTNNYAAIFEAGNVGIGTTAPGKLLTLQGNDNGIRIQAGTDTALYTDIINMYSNAEPFYILNNNQSGGTVKVLGRKVLVTGDPETYVNGYEGLSFVTGVANPVLANVRMVITNTGNVGIGDTSPAAMFTVGSGDIFQVTSAGAISTTNSTASTGITSGSIITSGGIGASGRINATTVVSTSSAGGVPYSVVMGGVTGDSGSVGYNGVPVGANWTYGASDAASQLHFSDGFDFRTAASGTAAATITWVNPMSISSGALSAAVVAVKGTKASTSSSDGALTVAGGLGVAKDSWINGVRVGHGAGSLDSNTVVGKGALDAATTSTQNTAIGTNALNVATDYDNTAVGNQALELLVTGNSNTAIGSRVLYKQTSGSANTGLGFNALAAVTTGQYNTVIGAEAGKKMTTASWNTGVGKDVLNEVTGEQNTAIGYSAFKNMTALNYSVAVGYNAGASAAGTFSGLTLLGYAAGTSMTSGANYNTLVGYQALTNMTSGTSNIAIGAFTSGNYGNVTTGSNNILIGNDTDIPTNTASNQLNIQNIIYGTGNSGTGSTLSTGNIGIGDSSPDFRLDVEKASATVAQFNRLTDDGTIISLAQDGTEEGTISVSTTTVSYNAFTGSHYAWTDATIEKGMLVTLTGENRRLGDRSDSEILYGITKSSTPNDSKILGSYLAVQESQKPASNSNPSLVMAAGNGEMWVVDKGENLEAGDYLISSDISGHAMLEDGTYNPAHIIARVAESVDWSTVTATVNGVKHKLISVLYGAFVKYKPNGTELAGLTLEGLDERITALEAANGSGGGIFDTIKTWLADAANGIASIFVDTVHVTNQLCIGNTCINETQLQGLLQNANIDSSPPDAGGVPEGGGGSSGGGEVGGGGETPTCTDPQILVDNVCTDPAPEPAPEPEPEPTPEPPAETP